MGEDDDGRIDRSVVGMEMQGGEVGRFSESGGKKADTPAEGAAVILSAFNWIYHGISAGEALKFPVITGSDLLGRLWSGSYAILADGIRNFEGRKLTRSREVVTLKPPGGVPVVSISTKYFELDDSAIYKIAFNSGTMYLPVSQCGLPNAARLGDAGELGIFAGNDGTTVTVSWTLKPALAGLVVLEISSEVTETAETSTETDRYLIDATGMPKTVTLSATTMGTTVTLTGDRLNETATPFPS